MVDMHKSKIILNKRECKFEENLFMPKPALNEIISGIKMSIVIKPITIT